MTAEEAGEKRGPSMASQLQPFSAGVGRSSRLQTASPQAGKRGYGDDVLNGGRGDPSPTSQQPQQHSHRGDGGDGGGGGGNRRGSRGGRQKPQSQQPHQRVAGPLASCADAAPVLPGGGRGDEEGPSRRPTRPQRHAATQPVSARPRPSAATQHGGNPRAARDGRERGGDASVRNGARKRDQQAAAAGHFGDRSDDVVADPGRGQASGQRSRKRAANELWQATYTRPGREYEHFHHAYSGGGGRYGSGGGASSASYYKNKRMEQAQLANQFLQANCRFLVCSGDYSEYTAIGNPSSLVDWVAVQHVTLLCHEEPMCPICLSPARSAKMTRCGHIYCWPCLLHHLDCFSQDSSSSQPSCPICGHSPVMKKELKSVSVSARKEVAPGDSLTFRLVKRRPASSIVEPHYRSGQPAAACKNVFSKLQHTSNEVLLETVVRREMAELSEMLTELQSDSGCVLQASFVTLAMELCKNREEDLLSEGSSSSSSSSASARTSAASNGAACHGGAGSTSAATVLSPSPAEPSSSTSPSSAWPAMTSSPPSFQSSPRRSSLDADHTRRAVWGVSDDTPAVTATAAAAPPSHPSSPDVKPPISGPAGANVPDVVPPMSGPAGAIVPADHGNLPAEDEAVPPPEPAPEPTPDAGHSPASRSDVTTSALADGSLAATAAVEQSVVEGRGAVADDCVYLYQAEDGHKVFLHPFTTRCLKEDYPDLLQAPLTLTGRVVEREELVMTDDLRHRYKHVRHLPLTCPFALCQLDVKPLLSDKTNAMFAGEIDSREKKRKRRLAEEERRERNAAQKARAAESTKGYQNPLYRQQLLPQASLSPSAELDYGYFQDAPMLGANEADPALSSTPPSMPDVEFSGVSAATPGSVLGGGAPPISYSRATNAAGLSTSPRSAAGWPSPPSFASALSTKGQEPLRERPAVSSSAAGGQSRMTVLGRISRPVGGTAAAAASGDDEEAAAAVPSYQDAFTHSLADDIDLALALAITKREASTDAPPRPAGRSKKEKKRRGQKLFDNASQRGN